MIKELKMDSRAIAELVLVSAQEIVRRIHAEMPLEPSDPHRRRIGRSPTRTTR